ncbi:hypothetical protein AALO_G00251960 [Alosa alosa]|uniref:Uncharacterized protein n=1 Tax=Alosa alosa TaxID=278164 RepID=A0AAV6FP14_9TELE|nr:hypothetical protein AALO_G00251960 [Alosa alosa]
MIFQKFHDRGNPAGPKEEELGRLAVHYTASPHFQENVFIEGSRPKHLQDLHTEAQEGLKILLQEEHKNGVDFLADQSNSEVEPWAERDAAGSHHRDESEGPGSIAANSSTSSASAASSVSNRPLLTRQGLRTHAPQHYATQHVFDITSLAQREKPF